MIYAFIIVNHAKDVSVFKKLKKVLRRKRIKRLHLRNTVS